jgi:glycerol kinase
MKKYILAIDQGTTGSRAVIFDKEGRVVTAAYQEFKQYFPKPGWVEHDPAEIWASVYATVQKVLRAVDPREVAAIGITNQRETSVLWDRSSGKPVAPAIVWQCRRTAGRCSEICRNTKLSRMITRKTGLPVDAYFSATKIEWILRNNRKVRISARQGRIAFGTTDSWVLWNLTGGAVHSTDYTNASRTMLFDIDKKRWDAVLLREFSVPAQILPEVRNSSGNFGVTARLGRLPAGIPVCGIAGDQQAALFGQACFDPATVKNTYGTGAFMLLNTGGKRPVSKYGLITTLACGPDGGPVYALEGSIFIAGAAVQWLRDGLQIIKSSGETELIAKSLPDNGGVYFVPALSGLGAPYWDPYARGSFYGITRGTTRAHFVRAALEAVCYQTADVVTAMRRDSGLRISQLRVDGGAAANDFLLQFQADILGIPVVRPKIIESTSLGAAYLAGLGCGFWRDVKDISRFWKPDTVFRPKMKRPQAVALCRGWHDAVERTLNVKGARIG